MYHQRLNQDRHAPEHSPTKPTNTLTYNRQITDNFSGRDISSMFERFLPDKFVCLKINIPQSEKKTESIPLTKQSMPKFAGFWCFEVGFVWVWPVWLRYEKHGTVWPNFLPKKVTRRPRERHEPPGNSSATVEKTLVRCCAIKATIAWGMVSTPWWLCGRTSTSNNKVSPHDDPCWIYTKVPSSL